MGKRKSQKKKNEMPEHMLISTVSSGALSFAAQNIEVLNVQDYAAAIDALAVEGEEVDVKNATVHFDFLASSFMMVEFVIYAMDQGAVFTNATEVNDTAALSTGNIRAALDAAIDSRYSYERVGTLYVDKAVNYGSSVLKIYGSKTLNLTRLAKLTAKYGYNKISGDDVPVIGLAAICVGGIGTTYSYDRFDRTGFNIKHPKLTMKLNA